LSRALVATASWRWLSVAAIAATAALVTTAGWAHPLHAVVAAVVLVLAGFVPEGIAVIVIATSSFTGAAPLLSPGPFEGGVRLTTDVQQSQFGTWAAGTHEDTRLILEFRSETVAARGQVLEVEGVVRSASRRYGGRATSVVAVADFAIRESPASAYSRIGDSIHQRVKDSILDGTEERGLLAGFLVGDTSDVGGVTLADMRLAGLSHFVAVSGSNVALYLALVAGLTLPFGIGPRRRAAVGFVALPVFVVATRFEPSVLRASVMAGLVLIGKVVGVALDVWQIVAVTVVALLTFDPWLAWNAGFQLSVVATCGVIVGSRWPGITGWVGRSVAVTAGAQIAVAPLLLAHFGSIPLLSALTNLVSAPLVALATLLGALGVLGLTSLIGVAAWISGWVIGIAQTSSRWPQLGPVDFVLAMVVAMLIWKLTRRRREYAAIAAAAVVLIVVVPHGPSLLAGQVAVLDVGQGDSILIAGDNGRFVLVDGGPDPGLLVRALGTMGIDHLEVVVLTHVHADHATGLQGLFGRVRVDQIWMNLEPHATQASELLLELAEAHSVPVAVVSDGMRLDLGALQVEVLGPVRKYASPNDQSMVLEVRGSGRSMLLSGDIEVFAQRDLTGVRADVLKVPHQGAGTSDPEWLVAVGASTAVISVGPNSFGHPVQWVIDLLVESGATVLRTDLDGTVVVDLTR